MSTMHDDVEGDGDSVSPITEIDQNLLLTGLPASFEMVVLVPKMQAPTVNGLEQWTADVYHWEPSGNKPKKLIERDAKVLIDVPHYQRGEQRIGKDLRGYFLERPPISVKVLVRRGPKGVFAIVDGGQTWRACADARVNAPMIAQLYTLPKENIQVEFVLFSISNFVQTVTADTRLRASAGATAAFLRKVNYDKADPLYGKLWGPETGDTTVLSPTTMTHCFYKLYHANTTPLEAMRPIARALQHACDTEILVDKTAHPVLRDFMNEMLLLSPRRINTVHAQAIAHVKRALARRPFTPTEIKLIQKAMTDEAKKTIAAGVKAKSINLKDPLVAAAYRPDKITICAERLARRLGVDPKKLLFNRK